MSAELARTVASIEWYHTLDLGHGVITPGWLDHRAVVGKVPLPGSLAGRRCLDVGTFNGFWAFEMERRGAAEVVAVDVLDPRRWDWPAGSDAATVEAIGRRMAHGEGFEIARAALSSGVRRVQRSVYDLDRRELGRFDLAYVGSLLVHLRDPVGALERVRAVAAEVVVVDGVDLVQTLRHPRTPLARLDGRGRPWWWYPNLAGLARLVEAAGFAVLGRPRLLLIPRGEGGRASRAPTAALRGGEARREAIAAWLGDPHGALRARRAV
jgi:tRNA (mo5U34)-methyltransferase